MPLALPAGHRHPGVRLDIGDSWMIDFPSLSKQAWPKESGELEAYYGNPRANGFATQNIVEVPVPWAMREGTKSVSAIEVHRKVSASLARILAAIWDLYGRDQAKIDAAHLNEFGGSFVVRANRNNPNKLSVHSYGAALDIAPDENPNGKPWVDGGQMMPRAVVDAFKAEGWAWGGDFSGTKDAMHFQATFDPHAGSPSLSGHPLLKKGSSGASVEVAQQLLGFVTQDGKFGTVTEKAVREFQQAHGLRVDGRIGDETWPVLIAQPNPPKSIISAVGNVFDRKAPKIVADLMDDFGLTDVQAAGIVGNIGHECGGFSLMQEESPVGGGAGGYGWCQWTGPRRAQFFEWCQAQGLSVDSDEGNYGFLVHELQTSEAKAIPAVKATSNLHDAMMAFEAAFERAGIKHYESRDAYAARALAAYHAGPPVEQPAPEQPPQPSPFPFPFPFPLPIPGLPTASSGGFPFQFPGQPAPPAGIPTFNLPIGDLFSVITRASRIMALVQSIPQTGMTVDRWLAAIEDGLTTAIRGPVKTVQAAPPPPLKLPLTIGANMPNTVTVPVVPATQSKINWTQIITGALQAVNLGTALAGGIDPKYGVVIAGGLGLVANTLTWIQRTWFTTSITPASLGS